MWNGNKQKQKQIKASSQVHHARACMSMPVYLFARRFLFGTIKSKVETFYGGNMHHKVTAYSTFYVTISVSKELFTCEGAKNCIHFTASEFPFYAD